jgi:hypothetical protein
MSLVTTQPEALSASAGTLWAGVANVPPSLLGGLPRAAGAAAPQDPAPRYGQIPTVRRLQGVGRMTARVISVIVGSGPRRDIPKVCRLGLRWRFGRTPHTGHGPAARRDKWRNPSSEGRGVMKVVLFCGGYGMRMRTAGGDLVPKPLQMVGFANYADVLTDAPLDTMIDRLKADDDIEGTAPIAKFPIWVNGGYFFALTRETFDLIPEYGDLVGDACMALAGTGQLLGYQHHGFCKRADTLKERAELDADYNAGQRPRMVWEQSSTRRSA